MKRSNLRILEIEEGEELQLKNTGKNIQQSHKRKLSQPKEGYPYEGTRSLQNSKYTGTKNFPLPHNNQNAKHTE